MKLNVIYISLIFWKENVCIVGLNIRSKIIWKLKIIYKEKMYIKYEIIAIKDLFILYGFTYIKKILNIWIKKFMVLI